MPKKERSGPGSRKGGGGLPGVYRSPLSNPRILKRV